MGQNRSTYLLLGEDATRVKHPPISAQLGGQWVRTAWPCPVTAELLWTAPELLRAPGAPGRGTLKADIFSIGIVLQEVLTRGPPYSSSGLSAEGTAPLSSFLGLSLAGVPM